jgi:EmrB/QacA subfamily drug resistance transporter
MHDPERDRPMFSRSSEAQRQPGAVVALPPRQRASRERRNTWILIATILGSGMVFLDSSVVNVALPRIQLDLNVDVGAAQWVVEAYALFLAALILVGGSLGDRYGRRRIFALGVAGFALASAWCGLAPSIGQLITARAVQGVAGAILTPGSLAIIRAFFDETRRGRAIGLWSGFSSITAALGPVVGGWLVQNATWRLVFFINLPLAVIVLLIVARQMPESRGEGEQRAALDWPGALLSTLGLGALVSGLIEADSLGLGSPLVLALVVLGLLALLAFVVVERVHAAPMMPLTLFRSPTFSGTNLLTFLLYAALNGALFFLPFNLILVQGYNAAAAGASLLPFTLIMFLLSRWSGGLVQRYGARLPLVIGPSIAAAGFLVFALQGVGGSYWTTFFPAIVLLGLGMAITVPPLTTAVLGAVSDRYAGVASGINNAVARVAALLAIAVLSIFVVQAFSADLASRLQRSDIAPSTRRALLAQSTRLAGLHISASVGEPLRRTLTTIIAQAFVSGFRIAMLIAAGLALASAVAAFLLVEDQGEERAQPRG